MSLTRAVAPARARSHARLVGLTAAWLVATLLSGCASLPFLPGNTRSEPAQAAPPVDVAVYRLDINAPAELKSLLMTHLDLARFQATPEGEAVTPVELDRLLAAAPAQARSLLETEGYFNAEVSAARLTPAPSSPGEDQGQGLNVDPSTGAAAPTLPAPSDLPVLLLTVEPGPRARIESVELTASGALQTAAAAQQPHALELLGRLRDDWPLPEGDVFRQSLWSSAKDATLARLRADSYPAARWTSTVARVDAATQRVQLAVEADSGPLYRLGAIRVEGLQRYDASSVVNTAPFGAGTPYSEKLMLDFQERLRRVGLFETSTIELDTTLATADAAPVFVRVREQPLQQATIGVGYSDNTGQRVTVEHLHRQVFGWRWMAKNKFELGRDQNTWEGDLSSHPQPGGYRYLLAANLQRLEAAGTVITSTRVRAGRAQDTERFERLVFAEALADTTVDGAERTSNRSFTGNFHWTRRDLDSVLLPTTGSAINLQTAAGYALAGEADNGAFARGYGRVTLYRPLGSTWYGTLRVEAGQVFAGERVGIPETLLFRAGGDESVRGYDYRSLGPVENDSVTGGRVLWTGSLEMARPLSSRLPSVWGAAFVDAGQAAGQWSELRPALGYGVGVRWRSPVGPLRLDLAYGHEVRAFRLHFSVGIAL